MRGRGMLRRARCPRGWTTRRTRREAAGAKWLKVSSNVSAGILNLESSGTSMGTGGIFQAMGRRIPAAPTIRPGAPFCSRLPVEPGQRRLPRAWLTSHRRTLALSALSAWTAPPPRQPLPIRRKFQNQPPQSASRRRDFEFGSTSLYLFLSGVVSLESTCRMPSEA